jgi:hypothetical protein
MLTWLKELLFKPKVGASDITSAVTDASDEHALIITTIGVHVTLDDVYAIEDALEGAFAKAGVGIVDGHDIAVDGSDANFYMYGPDADAMFAVARPILLANSVTSAAKATLRFGRVDNEQAKIETHLVASQ